MGKEKIGRREAHLVFLSFFVTAYSHPSCMYPLPLPHTPLSSVFLFLSLLFPRIVLSHFQVQLEISPLRTSVSALHMAVLRFLPPFRLLSRVWGYAHSVPLPRLVRKPFLRLYALAFGCNLDEMLYPLEHYKNLGEFFTRPLRPGCRPMSPLGIASPVDAVVVSCHEIIDGVLEQVCTVAMSRC